MSYSLTWLPDVLEAAGLKVALVPGWQARGHGDMGGVKGVICHHTATPTHAGNMPTLDTLIQGRSDLPGPLSQLGLGRDGTYYVIAAGRCYHAGVGRWQGLTDGNGNFIGIEAENGGRKQDLPWPKVQLEAYQRGVAAILKHVGRSAQYCAAHREYALPVGRKPDVVFDMAVFRMAVDALLKANVPPLGLIPAAELAPTGAVVSRPTLRRGSSDPWVKTLQSRLGLTPDGVFGAGTEAKLRVFQRERGMVPDGIAGPKTWLMLDKEPMQVPGS
jgi:hypothetical protein